MRQKTSQVWSSTDENFIKIIKSSTSQADALRQIGLPTRGASYKTIKKRINELKINTDHWQHGLIEYHRDKTSTLTETEKRLCINSDANPTNVRKWILKYNLINYNCDICDNNGQHLGQDLTLQLDHINGINNDHRIENLRFLCPNCHSQTKTWGSKRHKKKNYCQNCKKECSKKALHCYKCARKIRNNDVSSKIRPEKAALINDILQFKNNKSAIARKYNVSSNAVSKWYKKYNLTWEVVSDLN